MRNKATGKVKTTRRPPKIKGRFAIPRFPDHLREDACSVIEGYSVGLALGGDLIGSGTLVKWDNSYGILTAEHVVNNPECKRLRCDFSVSSEQRLQLICTPFAACFEFEMRYLRSVLLGKRKNNKFGPDIAIIVLPECTKLSTLKARKSFSPLDSNRAGKITRSLSDDGFHAVMGYLGRRVAVSEPERPFSITKEAHCLCGQTRAKRHFRRLGFDYVDVLSDRRPETSAPDSYEGMSGGGLWKVTVGRKREEAPTVLRVLDVTLAGVIFYQSDEVKNCRTVRCHGPHTVYGKLVKRLKS